MHQLSTRWSSLKPSATMKLTGKVSELRQAGVDVISFAAGEPHFDPPAFLYDAIQETQSGAYTKYTPVPGLPEARSATATWASQVYNRSVTEKNILLTHGAKSALHAAFQSLLDEGDEVVYQSPYWVSYPPLVQISGGVSKVIQTEAHENFKMSPEALEAAITPKTKAFLFCSPHNPTGIAYTQVELDALAEVLNRHPQVWVLSDDIYDHVVWSEAAGAHITKCPGFDSDRLIQVQSLSKSHAVTGWRVGFMCAPPNVIQLATRLMGHTLSHVPANLQHVLTVGYSHDFSFLKPWVAYFENNMKNALPILEDDINCEVVKPDGAFYMFPKVDKLYKPLSEKWDLPIKDDVSFCEAVLDKIQVGFVPGSAFGAPGYVRLTTAMGSERFIEGLSRLRNEVRT